MCEAEHRSVCEPGALQSSMLDARCVWFAARLVTQCGVLCFGTCKEKLGEHRSPYEARFRQSLPHRHAARPRTLATGRHTPA